MRGFARLFRPTYAGANIDWIRKKASAILERVLRLGPRDSGIRRSLMKIIGCDFHPSFQQIAMCDAETGELQERKLSHGDGQAERFYRELGEPALIGIEATGNSQWFLDLVHQLGHETRVGEVEPRRRPSRTILPGVGGAGVNRDRGDRK